jgi:hypothetical protein
VSCGLRRAGLLGVLAVLAAAPATAGAATPPVTPPSHAAAPVTAPSHAAVPASPAASAHPAATAPRAHPEASRPHPVAGPALPTIPVRAPQDASVVQRRLLVTINSVDEGFLLGLPGAGPKGPTAYVPPQPARSGADTGSVVLAAAAGLLAAVGSGAIALFLLLRPRPVPANPPARASISLSPEHRRARSRRRPARISQEAFDRLPPLLQLAVLDRARPSAEALEEA